VRFIETSDRATAKFGDGSRAARDGQEVRRAGKRPYVMNHSGAFAAGRRWRTCCAHLKLLKQAEVLGPSRRMCTWLRQQRPRRVDPGSQTARSLRSHHCDHQHYADDRISGALSGARDALSMLGWVMTLTNRTSKAIRVLETALRAESARTGSDAAGCPPRGTHTRSDLHDKAMAGLINHARRGSLGADSTVSSSTPWTTRLFAFKGRDSAEPIRG